DAVVHLATQDYIVGNELARAGDLAPANARLARAGVVMHRRRLLRKVRKNSVVLGDRFSENVEELAVDWVVDAGHRLPDDTLSGALVAATGHRPRSAGDCVAPRTVAEAVLEGRRRALELG
ncbi:MAG: 2,4-dienoyl-CoA reductase, partial [Microthrixaceae bacterium]|nr:2,4-dienoyl-CoA reductase [Microthrixaceae bacterium]